MSNRRDHPQAPGPTFPADPEHVGGLSSGEMEALIRDFDWSTTPLGQSASWSPALRMMTRFLLANRFPLLLWWGPQYVSIYNDAYRPILGAKHPWALGKPVSECWKEIWHILKPLIDTPFQGGPSTWNDDILLEINRHGFVEETHFTIAYSPVPDETVPTGIGGVLATVHEITGKMIGDRRGAVLRDLGARSAIGKTAEEACAIAGRTLAAHPKDIPFALLYLIEPDRRTARLAEVVGVTVGEPAAPLSIPLDSEGASPPIWPLAETMRNESIETVTGLSSRLDGRTPSGPWNDPPQTAVVAPIHSNKAHFLAGFLVAGVSSRLQLDDPYRDFLQLVTSQIATSIANARAYEEEKKRAEALAEIDRAKTAFFSNVSHEFRTPLTLMLGPIEELLARSHTELPPAAKTQLELTHRNSLRLLRLVNNLLDFSRIEAGRMRAVFEPTDLAAFTAELAGTFRAATDRAGLRLAVDCPTLSESIYVDREMWEKIVLNLVSNAFKFTFEGEIEVSLRAVGGFAELRVRDTGVGIPADEIAHVFERFHRVPNMRSRTHEGSGIGLALVQELAKLHGGAARAESALDEGSTFIVTVSLGKSHLPQEHLGGARSTSTSVGAAPFLQEALRWLPDETSASDEEMLPAEEVLPTPYPMGTPGVDRPRLLVADDNADMRQYLARLLSERYRVHTVSDGEAALTAARERRPDLILSDVMMPRLDGIALLREIRADASLSTIPVILLSARAGEESRVEGLEGGADDYLIKPFSARELLARVAAHLDLMRLRKQAQEALRESEQRFRAFVTASSDVVYRMNPDWSEMRFLDGRDFIPDTQQPNRTWLSKYIHPKDQPGVLAAVAEAIRTKSIFELEHQVLRVDGSLGWTHSRAVPLLDDNGDIVEWLGSARDITARKQADENIRRQNTILEAINRIFSEALLCNTEEDLGRRCLAIVERACGTVRGLIGIDAESRMDTVAMSESDLGHAEGQSPPLDSQIAAVIAVAKREGGSSREDLDSLEALAVAVEQVFLRKRAELAVREGEDRLRQAQKMESIGLLAGGIAHDFNNLLVGVIGNASLVEEMLPPGSPAADLVQGVIRTGEQLAHLTRQMLAYSGKGRFFVEVLDVSSMVRDIADLVRPSIPKKAALRFELPEDLLRIEADPSQVQQILMNLVINAGEAIGSRDGVVTVATRAQHVDVSFIRMHPQASDLTPGQYVALEVRDTGGGMDEAVKAKIFDPFFSTKFAGRGLGLAAVAGIVRGHKGAILVDSESGVGTTFTVLFPATARALEPHKVPPRRTVTQGSGVVLVIDDEQVVRDLAKKTLERNGYSVLIANDGPSAIDIFRRSPEHIDLTVLDLSMPGMNGEEALPELRKIRPEVKVLISSGYSEAEAMAMFEGQKVSGFVQKPYSAATLAEAVKQAMQ